MRKNPWLYLVVGGILIFGGWLGQVLFEEHYTSQEYFAEVVQESIEAELKELELTMIPVLDSVSTSDLLQFSDYSFTQRYPFFIYRNREVKIWSDYRFIPSYDKVEEVKALSVLSEGKNIYLVRKWLTESRSGRYAVVSLIPLTTSFTMQNRYLTDFSNRRIFRMQDVQLLLNKSPEALPVNIRGQDMLWMAKDENFLYNNSPFQISLFVIYATGIFFVLIGVVLAAIRLSLKKGSWVLLITTLMAWLVLKLVMAVFDFPERFINVELFDSRFFAVTWFERSFADLLLNTIALFIISVILFRNYRKVRILTRNRRWASMGIASLYVLVLNLIINYQYLQLRTIYFNSQISIDITGNFEIDSFRIFSVLVFLLVGASSALFFHVTFKHLEAYVHGFKDELFAIIGGSVLFVVFSLFVNLPIANLVFVSFLLAIILFRTGIHQSLQQASLSLTLYVLLWIVIESLIGGWCITKFEKTRDTNKMVRFAQNLALKNDYMAEFMIQEAIESIENDPSISARLSNPFLSKEYIINKISKGYLNAYLDKYVTSIYMYSHSGEGLPGFGTTYNYFEIRHRYAIEENSTEYDNVYILTQDIRSLSKHYMAFIPVKRYNNIIGYIILDFRQKRLAPENVYPELLVDNRFRDFQSSEFSYAIFEENYLIHSSGDMDYTFFDISKMGAKDIWAEDGYLHYKLVDNAYDVIVVSKPYNYYWQLASNASFFVAAYLLPIVLILIFLLLRNLTKGREISYMAKIQLFLNLAFFVPLLLVTVTTLSFITTSFREELLEGKITESHRLATQIEKETDAYLINSEAVDLLRDKLEQIASYGHFDATVFGTDGRMIITTQPDIFDDGLQSGYLNHEAYNRLIERNEASVVLNEAIGSLKYYTTYTSIRSRETNRLLGVLAIPFFRAESTIAANQVNAFTTILNVFVLVFLLALIGTFQTSKWLTTPLLMIRERLGTTSFSGENQPIAWDSDDEIGKLIHEYNNMLLKLEESREALARSQKETAWREVAQQVAHEIKNPLTPMKLTLQKLEMAIRKEDGSSKSQLKLSLQNLLSQLQMLNDIVTSFSEFAKMPIPKNEKINLVEVIKEVETLFKSDRRVALELHLHAREVFISADKKLMSRILSNIIINAGQSKKDGQDVVHVKILTSHPAGASSVLISIEDNGSGIKDEVVERVFIPRFSTKQEGSGIGLAVAKHGIEQTGGTIWFETTYGEGTTFYLQIPEVG